MTLISIYDVSGSVSDHLEIDDQISFVSGRTSKGSKHYYKGLGSWYNRHAVLQVSGLDTIIGENPVFYYGWDVTNKNFEGKFGIFKQKYQPYFSDFIGGCGPKEANIIPNSSFFRSALTVIDKVDYDLDNKQSYYVLDYKYSRDCMSDGGNLKGLVDLLLIMLEGDINFPWDKTAIRDINSEGYITDVADLFTSGDIIHKYGTVYSVLYSLHQLNKSMYISLVKSLGLIYAGIGDIPFVCRLILEMGNFNIELREDIETRAQLYTHLVGNVLLRGRNCASVEDVSFGDSVMIMYLDRFSQMLTSDTRRILNVW